MHVVFTCTLYMCTFTILKVLINAHCIHVHMCMCTFTILKVLMHAVYMYICVCVPLLY